MGRIAVVWCFTILMTGLLMGVWYVTQPMLVGLAHTISNGLIARGINTTDSDNMLTLSEVVINLFYPIIIIGLWWWAYNESQREDYRGYYA